MNLKSTRTKQAQKSDATSPAPRPPSLLDWKASHKLHRGLSFLDLAQELRDLIYSECFISTPPESCAKSFALSGKKTQTLIWVSPSFKGVRNKQKWVNHIPGIPNPAIRSAPSPNETSHRPGNTALLATCRQIHAEAAHILYEKNVFKLLAQMRPDRTGHLEETGIFEHYTTLIRHMRIELNFDWRDYKPLIMLKDLMASVHKSIIPLCPSLVELRWTILLKDGYYDRVLWLKWEPLWLNNREENLEARVALFSDSLNKLRPYVGPFLPVLQLDISPEQSRVYPMFRARENVAGLAPEEQKRRLAAVRENMQALSSDFQEAFRRMKDRLANA